LIDRAGRQVSLYSEEKRIPKPEECPTCGGASCTGTASTTAPSRFARVSGTAKFVFGQIFRGDRKRAWRKLSHNKQV